MRVVHSFIASDSVRDKPQAIVAVLCAYACLPGDLSQAGRSWAQALELARAGFDVWVVTRPEYRPAIERAMEKCQDMGRLQVLFWDAPIALAPLQHWRAGARLHRFLWYSSVGRAIAEWHAAVGMCVLRRVEQPSRASVTYLMLPSVQREGPARFAWRALWD
jgi:hypothetical protein